jgi:GTPase SAR1 family protein
LSVILISIVCILGLITGTVLTFKYKEELEETFVYAITSILLLCVAGLALAINHSPERDTALGILLQYIAVFIASGGILLLIPTLIKSLRKFNVPDVPTPEPLAIWSPPEVPNRSPFTSEERFSHQLILGGSGSGKTTLLEHFIAGDLTHPCSVIVMDSQGELINKILKVDIPRERVVLIDPTDINEGYSLALNLFDIHQDESLTPYDKEKNLNGVIELLTYTLNSLIGSSLTTKQDTLFRYLIRLLLVIPDATIHTMREILSAKSLGQYTPHISKLGDTAQAFFKDEYHSKAWDETKQQVVRRIYTLLENDTMSRMLSHSRSKLNMAKEMNEGKVILINSAKELLKEEGSAFFSRFMLSLITQAVNERASMKDRMPTYLYIDEASPILDKNIQTILETARKYKLGCILAFQSLGQVPVDITHSIMSNTAIKMAGGVSAKDARAIGEDMGTKADIIMAQPKHTFLIHAKSIGLQPLRVEPRALEKLPKRNDYRELVKENREKYYTLPEKKKKPTFSGDDIADLNRS